MIVCTVITILHRPAAFPLVGCGTVVFGADESYLYATATK